MEDVNKGTGAAMESTGEVKKTKRPRAWLAGLLALVMPGLGHLYLGRPIMAAGVWLGAIVLANLLWVAMLHPRWGWITIAVTALPALVYYIGQVVHAIIRSRRMERRLLAVPWYAFVVVIGLWIWGNGSVVPVFGHYETFRTTAAAMEQTLAAGDYVASDLGAYSGDEVQRGDIMIFLFPLDHEYKYMKRAIGLPGDTILIVDKVLHVNGEAFEEPSTVCFIDSAILPRKEGGLNSRDNFGPYVVPAGQYFVLGDNRDNSSDSRFWGCVPKEDIMGKVMSIYWSGDLGRVGTKVE